LEDRPETLICLQLQYRQTGEFMNRHEHTYRIRYGIKQHIEILAYSFGRVGVFEKTHLLT